MNADVPPPREPAPADEPRPPLGAWPRAYAVVIAELVLVILLLIALTRAFG